MKNASNKKIKRDLKKILLIFSKLNSNPIIKSKRMLPISIISLLEIIPNPYGPKIIPKNIRKITDGILNL
jgi:hypothetical protein